jgi:hypothetical protein
MVIRTYQVVLWIVFQTLFAKHGRIEPIGEVQRELIAGLGWDGFVIADPQEKRYPTERLGLIALEVGPRGFLILDDARFRMKTAVIIVKIVNRAQIAEVPVKGGLVRMRGGRNRGHHDVTTIA